MAEQSALSRLLNQLPSLAMQFYRGVESKEDKEREDREWAEMIKQFDFTEKQRDYTETSWEDKTEEIERAIFANMLQTWKLHGTGEMTGELLNLWNKYGVGKPPRMGPISAYDIQQEELSKKIGRGDITFTRDTNIYNKKIAEYDAKERARINKMMIGTETQPTTVGRGLGYKFVEGIPPIVYDEDDALERFYAQKDFSDYYTDMEDDFLGLDLKSTFVEGGETVGDYLTRVFGGIDWDEQRLGDVLGASTFHPEGGITGDLGLMGTWIDAFTEDISGYDIDPDIIERAKYFMDPNFGSKGPETFDEVIKIIQDKIDGEVQDNDFDYGVSTAGYPGRRD